MQEEKIQKISEAADYTLENIWTNNCKRLVGIGLVLENRETQKIQSYKRKQKFLVDLKKIENFWYLLWHRKSISHKMFEQLDNIGIKGQILKSALTSTLHRILKWNTVKDWLESVWF